jgi:hypothetical protein
MPGPTITVIDKTDKAKDWKVTPQQMVETCQTFVDKYFAPRWGTPCQLKLGTDFEPGNWAMAFFDVSDQAGVLGYHDLTPDGLPLAKIAVSAVLAAGKQVTITATHELSEMLIDPGANLIVQGGSDSTLFAFEVCDPVEEDTFKIGDFDVTNFVYPGWFAAAGGSRYVDPDGKLDQLGNVKSTFEIPARGYMPIFKDGQWTQIFGSLDKEQDFRKEDRSERRYARRIKRSLRRSERQK